MTDAEFEAAFDQHKDAVHRFAWRMLAALWIYVGANRGPAAGVPAVVQQPVVSLADFQPVEEVQLRVVGEMK